ncbi:MAG: hypothetical protein JO041_12340 [Acidobacteria bacterium]|nr:hypothetical protein [Acidobacteriota bacterium]
MSASVSFGEIQAMLDRCAPGWQWRLATHSRVISYNGKVYRSFPKFPTIELGHIRKMARYLGIMDCAKRELAGI